MSSSEGDYATFESSLSSKQKLVTQIPSSGTISDDVNDKRSTLLEIHDKVDSLFQDMMSTIEGSLETNREVVDYDSKNKLESVLTDDTPPKRSTLIEIHDKVDFLYQEMLDLLNEAKDEGVCGGLVQIDTHLGQQKISVSSDEIFGDSAHDDIEAIDAQANSSPHRKRSIIYYDPYQITSPACNKNDNEGKTCKPEKTQDKSSHRKRSMLYYDPYQVTPSVCIKDENEGETRKLEETHDRNHSNQSAHSATKQNNATHSKKRVSWNIPPIDDEKSRAHQERRKSDTIFQSYCLDSNTNNILPLRRRTDTDIHQCYQRPGGANQSSASFLETEQAHCDQRRDSVLDFLDNERAALAWSKEKHRQELPAIDIEHIAAHPSLNHAPKKDTPSETTREDIQTVKRERADSVFDYFSDECATLALSEKTLKEELLSVNPNNISLSFDSCNDIETSVSSSSLESIKGMHDTRRDHLDKERPMLGAAESNHQKGLLADDVTDPCYSQENTQPAKNQRRCSLLDYFDTDCGWSRIEVDHTMDNDGCSLARKEHVSGSRWRRWFSRKFFLKPWSFLSRLLGRFFGISKPGT